MLRVLSLNRTLVKASLMHIEAGKGETNPRTALKKASSFPRGQIPLLMLSMEFWLKMTLLCRK